MANSSSLFISETLCTFFSFTACNQDTRNGASTFTANVCSSSFMPRYEQVLLIIISVCSVFRKVGWMLASELMTLESKMGLSDLLIDTASTALWKRMKT